MWIEGYFSSWENKGHAVAWSMSIVFIKESKHKETGLKWCKLRPCIPMQIFVISWKYGRSTPIVGASAEPSIEQVWKDFATKVKKSAWINQWQVKVYTED